MIDYTFVLYVMSVSFSHIPSMKIEILHMAYSKQIQNGMSKQQTSSRRRNSYTQTWDDWEILGKEFLHLLCFLLMQRRWIKNAIV